MRAVTAGRLIGPGINRRRKGFTLTELTLAMTILAISMIPIIRSITVSFQSSGRIEAMTHALAAAAGQLDKAKAMCVTDYPADGALAVNCQSAGNGVLFTITDTTAYIDDARTVTVTAGCDDDGNGTLSENEIDVTLKTIIAARY